MFSWAKYKDNGLPYGPKWNEYSIREKVDSEIGNELKICNNVVKGEEHYLSEAPRYYVERNLHHMNLKFVNHPFSPSRWQNLYLIAVKLSAVNKDS